MPSSNAAMVRPGPAGDSRRGGLPGAFVRSRRRDPVHRRPRGRALRVGRRGPSLHRHGPVLRRRAPRTRPPRGDAPRCTEAAAARDDLRRTHPGRGAPGRSHLRPGARLRAGQAGVVGHRSRHERGAPGARASPAATAWSSSTVATTGTPTCCWRAGGAASPRWACPASAGVPSSAVADTIVVPYNVVPELDERVACVIVEPVAANMGLVAPAPGFLAGLRRACDGRRRPPRLRRGHHRLPGRRRAACRRARGCARPVVLRQGDRRRPPRGRVRGQA